MIFNIPEDISIVNTEGTPTAQNPDFNLKGDITPNLVMKQRNIWNLVIEASAQARKLLLLQKKVKLGSLICNTEDYEVAIR